MKVLETVVAVVFLLIVASAITYRSNTISSADVRAPSHHLELKTVDALDECSKAIAENFGLSDWSNIPPASNFEAKSDPDTKNFYFAWPKGRITFTSPMGDIPISASCVGTLEPFSVKYVTVNGKDIL